MLLILKTLYDMTECTEITGCNACTNPDPACDKCSSGKVETPTKDSDGNPECTG